MPEKRATTQIAFYCFEMSNPTCFMVSFIALGSFACSSALSQYHLRIVQPASCDNGAGFVHYLADSPEGWSAHKEFGVSGASTT